MDNYLYEQNLQWQEKSYNTGTQRELLIQILPLISTDQILAISGIRRCGKSFLLKQIINSILDSGTPPQNILFLNLELPGFVGQPAHTVLSGPQCQDKN